IESLQPYNRTHGLPECAPLGLLQATSIEDKHHTLNLVAMRVGGEVRIGTGGHPAHGVTVVMGDWILEDGAEIFRGSGPVNPLQVKDDSSYTFDVAFGPKGPAGGVRLRDGLRDMREAVADAIWQLAAYVP